MLYICLSSAVLMNILYMYIYAAAQTDMDFGRIEDQFRVNAMGPLRVTYGLLGNLKAGSKVFIITSRMGSVGDNGSGSYYGYRMSKVSIHRILGLS